jgi:hypothetical protein
MNAVYHEIQRKLCRQGLNVKQRQIETFGGDKIWVVFSNEPGCSFSIQANSQQEAWASAWRLVAKLRNNSDKPRMILPFPEIFPSYNWIA